MSRWYNEISVLTIRPYPRDEVTQSMCCVLCVPSSSHYIEQMQCGIEESKWRMITRWTFSVVSVSGQIYCRQYSEFFSALTFGVVVRAWLRIDGPYEVRLFARIHANSWSWQTQLYAAHSISLDICSYASCKMMMMMTKNDDEIGLEQCNGPPTKLKLWRCCCYCCCDLCCCAQSQTIKSISC